MDNEAKKYNTDLQHEDWSAMDITEDSESEESNSRENSFTKISKFYNE